MGMMDALVMELDRECATTRKLLARVPDDKLDWRPHAKSTPLGKLGNHIATLPGRFCEALQADGMDIAKFTPPPPPTSAADLVKTLDDGLANAKRILAAMDDKAAMGTWTFSMAGKELLSMPRIALVRTLILNHSIHHRGQLSVYLRLLDVPLPPIYGPTADENPFV
jgi:uncharacterized damage-inducible protein DinB